MELALKLAPCSESQWMAAAVSCIPMESVRYKPLSRAYRVTQWMKESKKFEIVDGVFRKTERSSKPERHSAARLLWAKLQDTKMLSESDAREIWNQGTWKDYSRDLVRFGWCVRCDDGSIAWVGPENITFAQFQQKRRGQCSQ